MDKLRLRFEKTGKAVYISHLDLMRVMQRAFLRADVPLKYSEGFNPHALLSIALPLSVGHASVCELMDFRLSGETDLSELPARLSSVMPEGIRVTEAYEAEQKTVELKWLRIEGRFEYDARDTYEMAAGVIDLFSRDMITAERRTKRGEGEFDIAPHIYSISVAPGEKAVTVGTIISAQDPTINPELLISALGRNCPEYEPDFAFFTRIETYDKNMLAFR